MTIKTVELESVVGVTTKKLPNLTLPQIAFAGKSNVGKSSLINALINRKSYARTSSTPGKTQTMNFYNVNREFYFVDLPGYGYAKVSLDFKAQWGPMIEKYLSESKLLKDVCLLIDSRRGCASDDDMMMYGWLTYYGFNPLIVATKADKLKKSELEHSIESIRSSLGNSDIRLVAFSATKKTGRDEIAGYLEEKINI